MSGFDDIEDDAYLTTEQAAAILSRAPQTVKEWRCHGKGPAYTKINNRVVYRRSAVIRWSSEHSVSDGLHGQIVGN